MKEFRYDSNEAYEKAIADLEKEINDKYLAGKSYEERLPLFRQKEELEGEYGAFKRLNVKVGDGVTYVAGYYGLGGDEYPATVIKRTAKTITIRHCKSRGDVEHGHDYYGNQKWIIEEDENGHVETCHWHPAKGCFVTSGGCIVVNGRRRYENPSF